MSTKKPVEKTEKKTAAKDAVCMYLGPTIRGVIRHNQIFPKAAAVVREELANKLPEGAAALIVDGNKLPEARQEMREPGSALLHYCESLKRR